MQENTLLKDTERKGIVLQPDYDFDRKTHHSYKSVTTTLDTINFVRGKCKLIGKNEIHGNTEYEKSGIENSAWGLTRYAASDMGYQIVHSWTSFQKLIYPNKSTKVSIGYLTPITAPPTEMKVIFSVINRPLDVMTELNLKNTILEVDQAICTRILDAMFRMELDGSMIFDKIILRMGGFHIVICMLNTMFSRFKDSGIIYSFMCLFIYFLIIVCIYFFSIVTICIYF